MRLALFLLLLPALALGGGKGGGQRTQQQYRTGGSKALLRILPGGVQPGQTATGSLATASGGAVTTTRASSKTCTRSDGTLVTLSANQPCVELQGLLVEGPSTNIALQSAALDNAAWSPQHGSVTPNTTVAPDGTTTADSVVDNAVSTFHGIAQSFTATAAPWTAGAYFKGTGNSACVSIQFGNSGAQATFNLTTGAVVGVTSGAVSGASQAIGGYFRFSATETETAAADQFYFLANPSCVTGSTPTYVGTSQAMFVAWGGHDEAQPFATSYIPTGASTASRAADVVSVANPLTAAFPFCLAATLTPESGAAWAAANRVGLLLGIEGAANSLRNLLSGGVLYNSDFDGAGTQAGLTATEPTSGTHRVILGKTALTGYLLSIDGVASGSAFGTGTGLASQPSTLYLGTSTGSDVMWGYLSDIEVAKSGCQ